MRIIIHHKNANCRKHQVNGDTDIRACKWPQIINSASDEHFILYAFHIFFNFSIAPLRTSAMFQATELLNTQILCYMLEYCMERVSREVVQLDLSSGIPFVSVVFFKSGRDDVMHGG